MNIHEYQANTLFRQYGIPVLEGMVAGNGEEAVKAAEALGGSVWVVKAQVHAGGRGKAGGVRLAKSFAEVKGLAESMISKRLVTHQSSPEGVPVDQVFVVSGVEIRKEYYLALAMDTRNAGLMFIASAEGGTEIETIAREMPDAIVRQSIDLAIGVKPYMCAAMAEKLGIPAQQQKQFTNIMESMYRLFVEKDCAMVEINPLAEISDGLAALDSKVNFEDNALFRHPDIAELRDIRQEDAREVEAARYDLNYVGLDGSIGCMVNGAGLAMATMDMIQHHGGRPANFLDVGGSATEENISGAFRILLSDTQVKSILVNIFGGIMMCDVIAAGIVAAAQKTRVKVPLVVRLEGTNADKGKQILADSGLDILSADTFERGVWAAVLAAQRSGGE